MTIGKARGRGLHIDLRPFGTSRDFRFLFASRTITLAGSQATEVALLVQARQLTGSPIDVGLLGAAELVPLVLFGLYGGMLADRLDRRLLARWPEAGLGGIAVLLVVNAALPRPSVAVVCAGRGDDGPGRPAASVARRLGAADCAA